MAGTKVRCQKCYQRVKPTWSADKKRSSCPNCGVFFPSDEPLDLDFLNEQSSTVVPEKMPAQKASAPAPPFKQIAPHLVSERFEPVTRLRLFQLLDEAYHQGSCDAELLYLGARYAISLGRMSAAKAFINRLSDLLKDNGRPSPSYFPVGLLSLQLATSTQERAALLAELQTLATSSPLLGKVLRLVGGIETELLPQSPHILLRDIQLNANGLGRDVLELATAETNGRGAMSGLKAVQGYSRVASEAYRGGDLTGARQALESILLLDGDQADVLRNLITIASEQQDVEAYERYWRRYVKVLLWRIMRNDDPLVAYDELLRFYRKVATITDREFNETPGKLADKLRTPGLMSRWLEAHAGLIWLDSVTRPHRETQANLNATQLDHGWLGHLGLMKYWCRIFYPEFYRYLDVSVSSGSASITKRNRSQPTGNLSFDPALNLLTRFVEWTNIGFDLDYNSADDQMIDNEHTEKIVALVGCVARVPLQAYVPKLQAKFETDDNNTIPFRRLWQEACSRPFRARRDQYFGEKSWPQLIALYGDQRPDPELLDKLTPMSRLFLAYALCHEQRAKEGFDIACDLLTDLSAEEFAEEAQTMEWWQAIFNMSLEQAIKADQNTGVKRISDRLKRVPRLEVAPDFVEKSLKGIADIESRLKVEAIMDSLKTHIQGGRFDAAIQLVQTLPEGSAEAKERKQSLLEQVRFEQGFDKCSDFVKNGKFKEAKALIRSLQASSKVAKERRDEIISQIESAESNYKESERINKLVDDAVARAKECIGRRAYDQARQAIIRLPSTPADLVELKENFLQQINKLEREEQSVKRENEQILSYLRGRQVDMFRVSQIAREYRVDITNPFEYNSLLKAVQKQVRGY